MKNSKIILLALPITIILICYAAYEYGYLTLVSTQTELQDTRKQKEKMLFKSAATIAKKQQVASTLHFLRPLKGADDEGIIRDPSAAGAMQKLQSTIKGIIVQAGGQVSGEKGEAPKTSGAYMIYETEVVAILPDGRALNEIVAAIETSNPHMVIKHLDARVNNPKQPRDLTARFKIAAMGVRR